MQFSFMQGLTGTGYGWVGFGWGGMGWEGNALLGQRRWSGRGVSTAFKCFSSPSRAGWLFLG